MEEKASRALGISHLDVRSVLLSSTKGNLLIACADRQYSRNSMKHNALHASSSRKSGRVLLRELRGFHQKHNISNTPFISAFLHIVSFENESTTAIMKQIFFYTKCLNEHSRRDKAYF